MPRPCKKRRVCAQPKWRYFGVIEQSVIGEDQVVMTVDEYETIRLIDFEGVTQEQCALQMDVARTTAQAIYSSARMKLAKCLVEGKALVIEGGNYTFCDGTFPMYGCQKACCHMSAKTTNKQVKKGEEMMRIAVTYEEGKIFGHFGHTAFFKIYDVQEGQIISSEVMSTNGSGHGALAGFLAQNQVNVLICGGIGGGAQNALREAGIQFYGGVEGDADEAVAALLGNCLDYNPNIKCTHHSHGEGETCGEHGCGNH